MKVVAIPFLDESSEVVGRNLRIAATHPAIDLVWGISGPGFDSANLDSAPSSIEIVEQQRIGIRRPGKGDAMNTAIARANEMDVDRLHFYDADITNFSHDWITGAEGAADAGFEVVRHSFPRAATDAMITWMITKPVMAMRFPRTILPRIGQPLGGELLLTTEAIATMAETERVKQRSDWGIDTEITFHSVAGGYSLYEHHVSDGKRHSLYGSLAELKDMAIECFDSVATLPAVSIPQIKHLAEATTPVPVDLRTESGFSPEASLPLLTARWVPGEHDFAAHLPPDLSAATEQMVRTGDYGFLDEAAWYRILGFMIPNPPTADSGAGALLFRLWVGRVFHYTKNHVSLGYEHALDYLASTIAEYERAGKPPS